MDGWASPWHLLIVAAVFVLLFGSKKLPDAARSLGRSMRIFKTEIKGMHDDDAQPAPITAAPVPPAAPVAPPAPAATPVEQPAQPAEQPAPHTH